MRAISQEEGNIITAEKSILNDEALAEIDLEEDGLGFNWDKAFKYAVKEYSRQLETYTRNSYQESGDERKLRL